MNNWTKGLIAAGLLPTMAFGWPHVHIHINTPHIPNPIPIVVKTVTIVEKPVIVEAKTGIAVAKVATGTSPGNAFKPVVAEIKNTPHQTGEVINSSASFVGAVASVPTKVGGDLAGSVAGKPGLFVFDTFTFFYQLENETSQTAFIAVGNTLQGKSILEANPVSVALAAALRSAHDQHMGVAKPLPEAFKTQLAKFIPPNILAKAKYCIGETRLSLPDALIGFNHELLHPEDGYAVTVDDLIIFSSEPNPNSLRDVAWVAHELTHVGQYDRYGGINGFAFNYSTKWDGLFKSTLEDEAVAKQNLVKQELAPHQVAALTGKML